MALNTLIALAAVAGLVALLSQGGRRSPAAPRAVDDMQRAADETAAHAPVNTMSPVLDGIGV
jgi:hypothetical protein